MPGTSRTGSAARREPASYRLLLDQNFPKPPGFDISLVDATVEVVHLVDFDSSLSKAGTPDWFLYLRAAEAKFDAMVTRDRNQLGLPEEMWILTRIKLTLVTFRQAIEDPIVEWGQVLAYLPEIRRRNQERSSQILLLPRPELSSKSVVRPRDGLHQLADDQGIAAQEIRHDAEVNVLDYLDGRGERARFERLLKLRTAT
jgi:hypothetical protein